MSAFLCQRELGRLGRANTTSWPGGGLVSPLIHPNRTSYQVTTVPPVDLRRFTPDGRVGGRLWWW
jgi:hypothetical protein